MIAIAAIQHSEDWIVTDRERGWPPRFQLQRLEGTRLFTADLMSSLLRHLPITKLRAEPPPMDIQAVLAAECHSKAVVFIHGLSGSAVETWSDFETMLPAMPECRYTDLFFYGYDGLRADLNASAALFRDFLARLFGDPGTTLAGVIPPAAQRPDDFRYTSILIVGHSLGAVLARRALVDATRNAEAWSSHCSLCLFAPAHLGAKVTDLVLEALPSLPILKPFISLVRFQSPLIDQLRKGSTTLRQLQDDALAATAGGANPHLKARKVLLAQYERIVETESFPIDPPPITLVNKKHTDLCKPGPGYQDPVIHVASCL